jgi:hypothetical protein
MELEMLYKPRDHDGPCDPSSARLQSIRLSLAIIVRITKE